jgi:hypothetical protein
MIPKVIHYCWFGGSKKTKLIKDCIFSWKLNLPDYEIKEWNEGNSDLTLPFVQEAYKLKKWAFVSDFIRLKVLYENGGIYLDTDMIVLKPFDKLLINQCFLGAENLEFINGAAIGAVKNNKFINACLLKYNFIEITNEIDWGLITIPRIITDVFKNSNNFYWPFDKIIQREGVVIYPSSYFYPLSYENKGDIINYKKYLTVDSLAVHLWSSSWVEYSEFHYLEKGNYFLGFKKIIKKIFMQKNISALYLKQIALAVKESINK